MAVRTIRSWAAIAAAAVGLALASCGGADAQALRPNIVFIMADDLGNADLGYRGGQITTPEYRQARE